MRNSLQGKKILIIDDEHTMLRLVEITVARAGAQVYTATNGQEGLRQFHTCQPDLVFLDVMMPGADGFETCRLIRESSDVPIIMLTVLDHDKHIIRGFDCGIDDYVTKPFNPDVLVARARAVLHRTTLSTLAQEPIIYSDGYLTIDTKARRVLVQGEPVKLSAKEYQILTYLLQNAGQVLTLRQILENIWGWECRDNTDYVHVYVHRLRQKLEADPKSPNYLVTAHGVGYRFDKVSLPPE